MHTSPLIVRSDEVIEILVDVVLDVVDVVVVVDEADVETSLSLSPSSLEMISLKFRNLANLKVKMLYGLYFDQKHI